MRVHEGAYQFRHWSLPLLSWWTICRWMGSSPRGPEYGRSDCSPVEAGVTRARPLTHMGLDLSQGLILLSNSSRPRASRPHNENHPGNKTNPL